MKERDINFFRPLWRRVTVTAACAIWAALELLGTHDPTWILIALGFTAYAVWSFFITFDNGAVSAPQPGTPQVEDKQGGDDVPPQA